MMLSPTSESINTETPSQINQQLHSNEQSTQEVQQEQQKQEVNQQIIQTNDTSTENKSPSQLEQRLVYQTTQPQTYLQQLPSSQPPTTTQLIQTSQQQPSNLATQILQPVNIFSQSSSLLSKTAAPPPIPKPQKEIFKLIIPDVLKENFDKEGENKWRMPNADITDYFNYGFCEASFKEYTTKVRTWRGSFPMDENYQRNKYNLDKLNDQIPMDYGGCSNPNDEGLLETPQDYNPFQKEQFINSAIEYLIDSFDMMRQKTDFMEIISNNNVLSKYVQKHDEDIMENRQLQEKEKEQQLKYFDPLGSYSFSKNYAEYISQRPKAIDFIALQHQIMHNIEVKNLIIQPTDRGNKSNQLQGQNTEKSKLQPQQLNKTSNTNTNLPAEPPKPQMLLNTIQNNLMFGQRSGGIMTLQMQMFYQQQQQQYLAQMLKTQMGVNQQPFYQQYNRNNTSYTAGNTIPGMFQASYGKSQVNNNNFYNNSNGSQQQGYQDNRVNQNKGFQSGNLSQNILHQSSRIGSNQYQPYNNTQQNYSQQQQSQTTLNVNEEQTEYSITRNAEKNKEIPKNSSNKHKTKYDEDRERSRKRNRSDSSSRSSRSSRGASSSSQERRHKRKAKDNYQSSKRIKDDSYDRKKSNKESKKYPTTQKDDGKYSKEQKQSQQGFKNKEFGEKEKQKETRRRDSFDKRDSRDQESRKQQRGQDNEREKSDTGKRKYQEKETDKYRTNKDREESQKDKSYSSKRINEDIGESKSTISRTSVSQQKTPQSSNSVVPINLNTKTSVGTSILQRIQKKSDPIPTPPPQINVAPSKQSNSTTTTTKIVIKTNGNNQDQSKSFPKKSQKDPSRERERERSHKKSNSPSRSSHHHNHHSHKDKSSLPQKRSRSPQKQQNKKTRKDSLSSSSSKSNSNLRDPPTKGSENRSSQQTNTGNKSKQETFSSKKQDDNQIIKREKSGTSNAGATSDNRKHETHPVFFSQYFNALKKSEEDISNHSRKSSSHSLSQERSYSPPRQTKRNYKD